VSNKTWDLGQQVAQELQVKRQCSTAYLVSPNGRLASDFRANIYTRFSSSSYVLYGLSLPQYWTWSPYHIWWRKRSYHYAFVLHFSQQSVTSFLLLWHFHPQSTHRNEVSFCIKI